MKKRNQVWMIGVMLVACSLVVLSARANEDGELGQKAAGTVDCPVESDRKTKVVDETSIGRVSAEKKSKKSSTSHEGK